MGVAMSSIWFKLMCYYLLILKKIKIKDDYAKSSKNVWVLEENGE